MGGTVDESTPWCRSCARGVARVPAWRWNPAHLANTSRCRDIWDAKPVPVPNQREDDEDD